MKFSLLVAMGVGLTLGVAGCGESGPRAPGGSARHEHTPPHGGTPVVLGDELYHLELVHDAASGRMTAYLFDGHLENFVRVAAPEFEVLARLKGGEQTLKFAARPNTETGERVGDSAQFEAQADWMKGSVEFDGVLKSLTIRGKNFEGVAFNFPRGNEDTAPRR